MKKFTFLCILFLFAISIAAQVPAGFSYQAVVRNTLGDIVASKAVKFRFSILQNSATGTAVYIETQSVTTNAFGLANLKVGMGTPASGNFGTISWDSTPFFLKVELDPGNSNSFSNLGTTQLLSVPYALHARTVEIEADGDPTNEIQALSISGTSLSLSKGGGTVTLPSSGGGDNWGTDYVRTDATLSGQGTTAQPLMVSQQSATTGQVLKWNGTAWVPSEDEGLTLPYSGETSIGTSAFGIRHTFTSGNTYGGYFSSSSSSGTGVFGLSKLCGVRGKSDATTGDTYGGDFTSNSSSGIGVRGEASASSGITHGGFFESNSSSGTGVWGKSKLYGVKGSATATVGVTYGGYFENPSNGGRGILSEATATSGMTYGGVFVSASTQGVGISGYGSATSGTNYGGYFTSGSTTGYGAYGQSAKYGIYGKSIGNQGRAVTGEATGTASIGVHGVALNSNSTGVWGEGSNYDFYANGPGVDYGTGSSIRWKRNIIAIPDPLEKIAALRGVFFDWDEEHGGKHDIGMIAEEVGKVLPEIVIYEENGIDAMGMDYSKIGPLLIEAVKELKTENDLLKSRLEKIESIMGGMSQK